VSRSRNRQCDGDSSRRVISRGNRTDEEHHLPALFSWRPVYTISATVRDVLAHGVRPAETVSRSCARSRTALLSILVYEATGDQLLTRRRVSSRPRECVFGRDSTVAICAMVRELGLPVNFVRTIRERSCGRLGHAGSRGALFSGVVTCLSHRWVGIAQFPLPGEAHTTVWRLHCFVALAKEFRSCRLRT